VTIARPVASAAASLVVGLRYLIIGGWAAAVAAALLFMQPLSSGGTISDLIPAGSPAAHEAADATRTFGFPLDAGVAVVQRDPGGMPAAVQARAVRQAVTVDQQNGAGLPGLLGAFPLPDAAGLLSSTAERDTTVVTYLFFSGGTSFASQTAGARLYEQRYLSQPGDDAVGVTGPIPARYEQGVIIQRDLILVELFTVLAIAVITGVRFRSLVAPLVALLCAGTAYVLAVRIVAWAAARENVSLPADLEPVLVVLLLGVTTDYTVFYLSGMQSALAAGSARLEAARRAAAESSPIILAAGIVVAAGSASLVVARTGLLRAFGPGLALAVLIAMTVSMTLAPALIALPGKWLAPRRTRVTSVTHVTRDSVNTAAARLVALLVVLACGAGLAVAASDARRLGLGSPLITELPAASEPVRAYDAAAHGFAAGILSPTEILVLGPGVTGPGGFQGGGVPLARQSAALARLQSSLAAMKGVAEVAGPASVPAEVASLVPPAHNPVLAASGDAARYVVITSSDPLDAEAVQAVRSLRSEMPALGREAGLTGVRFEVGGQTALTADAIDSVTADLKRIAVAIGVVTLVLLLLFLRSLFAPVYLLAASGAAVLASLGLTVLICRDLFGSTDLVYYVPFAAGVLLVSLGADYNVFVAGRIWEEARGRPVAAAVAMAAPRASRAITTAGVALAASFALLALIPLLQFRQIAIAMGVGVIVDALVVRSLLIPALIVLFGRPGMWPGYRRY
jgi:putative drug exporter of the RND superfamily